TTVDPPVTALSFAVDVGTHEVPVPVGVGIGVPSGPGLFALDENVLLLQAVRAADSPIIVKVRAANISFFVFKVFIHFNEYAMPVPRMPDSISARSFST